MITNFTELEQLLAYYGDNEKFLYLEDVLFELDNVRRNGIFIENETKDAVTSIFLYAQKDELVTTGATFQLLCDGKTYLLQLLELVKEECPRVLAIKERVANTCAGDWGCAKDGNIVSKGTNSYTVWAVRNEVKFKSENREFLLHLIPDLKFLLQQCKKEEVLVA